MNELALFAGAGGGILGGKLLGWRTVCAVERDAYASQVLAQRQNDGVLEAFPIWSDITTFDGTRWRGIVDVVSGGFPCQDISAAGKGAGIEGARSGMWKEMARIISEVRPTYAFVENSPMLTTRGLGTVLADLASMGFDAEWGVLSAADVGANHQRERIWILAKQRDILSHAEHDGARWWKQQQESFKKESRNSIRKLADTDMFGCNDRQSQKQSTEARLDAFSDPASSGSDVANSRCEHGCERHTARMDSRKKEWSPCTVQHQSSCEGFNQVPNTTKHRLQSCTAHARQPSESIASSRWWGAEPNVGRVANGVAFRMERLKAIGNGQVPLCAATAFELLKARLT
jgi:DNA (cytosine-5)-methyltransferase 1